MPHLKGALTSLNSTINLFSLDSFEMWFMYVSNLVIHSLFYYRIFKGFIIYVLFDLKNLSFCVDIFQTNIDTLLDFSCNSDGCAIRVRSSDPPLKVKVNEA